MTILHEGWKREWVFSARNNHELLNRARGLSAAEVAMIVEGNATDTEWAMALLWLLDTAVAWNRPKKARRQLADIVRRMVPYGFDGPQHHIVDAAGIRRRGYGSCGDGAALVASVLVDQTELGVFVAGAYPATLCYETVGGLPQYAHARVMLDRQPVEPWPDARRPEARGCTSLDDVSALLNAQT